MGSQVEVVAAGPPGLLDRARRRIEELESRWSRFLPSSDVSRLNRSGEWVEVTADTLVLIERSIDAWRLTGGAFDPTVLSSLVAHGYADSMAETPGTTRLSGPARRGPAPTPTVIEIDGSAVRLPRGVGFDPGGIGKGLAADLVATELLDEADAVMVSLGGDVRVAGATPAGWIVAVEDPTDRDRVIAELHVADGGVCTSSVRAKTWRADGAPVHHLIDPTTGEPIASSVVAATVLAGEAWAAEAMTKAAIAAEPLSALTFLESLDVEGLLVDVDGVIWRTPGVRRFEA